MYRIILESALLASIFQLAGAMERTVPQGLPFQFDQKDQLFADAWVQNYIQGVSGVTKLEIQLMKDQGAETYLHDSVAQRFAEEIKSAVSQPLTSDLRILIAVRSQFPTLYERHVQDTETLYRNNDHGVNDARQHRYAAQVMCILHTLLQKQVAQQNPDV